MLHPSLLCDIVDINGQIWYAALYRECLAGAQIIFPESGRGLGHVTPTIFGSTVGYPSDSLASCLKTEQHYRII